MVTRFDQLAPMIPLHGILVTVLAVMIAMNLFCLAFVLADGHTRRLAFVNVAGILILSAVLWRLL